ncbi:MAG: hypothetical protein MRJ68_05560 [Nitrospira sp.]|nr:hypothetical protein [Nitrospira sp.]
MNQPGFMFQSLYCYEDSDSPDTFYYVPGEPSPERDPQGRPTLSLLAFEDTAILQLGARWGPEEKTLDALRRAIVDKFPTRCLIPAQVRLVHSPVTIRSADIIVTGENGQSELLQSVTTSGLPPFMAIFNVRLSVLAKASVIRALYGTANHLTVRYRGLFTTVLPVSTAISGDARHEVQSLRSSSTVDEARVVVDRALISGQFKLTRYSTPGVPPDFNELVEEEARVAAAKALRRLAQGQAKEADPELLRFAVTISKPLSQNTSFDVSTDVSTWFPQGQGKIHVRVVEAICGNNP